MELEEIVTSTELLAKEKERNDNVESEKPSVPAKVEAATGALSAKTESSTATDKTADKSATPNLNAWLKAFGAPKKPKKQDEEEPTKKEEKSPVDSSSSTNASSPLVTNVVEQSFASPAPRTTRKASTGSTISERSSFSQDPDSPRIGIDERCGSYPAPYPSPLGASPIMTSPKEDIAKPTSPYPMNGAIRVGFYQDTTTKSSPEKSCSPRDQSSASPYSNYAQHLYVSTTTASAGSNAYSNLSTTSAPKTPTQLSTSSLGFNNKNKTPSYFDQYKQPKSQDSDYNSSVSSNPNSPYQSSQQSPYPAEQSPYHQPQMSPYTHQSPVAAPSTISPVAQQESPQSQIKQHSPVVPAVTPQTQPSQTQTQTQTQPTPQQQQPAQSLANVVQPLTDVQTQLQYAQQQSNLHGYMGYGASAYTSNYGHNLMDPTSGMNPMLMPSMPNKMTPVPGKHDPIPSVDGQTELLNLDSSKNTAMNTSNKSTKMHDAMGGHDLAANKPRDYAKELNTTKAHSGPVSTGYDYNVFDPFNKNMAYNNMSTSKALEMFNRAATMSFSKPFPNPLTSSSGKNDTTAEVSKSTTAPSMPDHHTYHHANQSLNMGYGMDPKAAHMANAYGQHDQQQQQAHQQQMHNSHQHQLQHQQQAHQNYTSHPKPAELNVPSLHQPRYDMSAYKPPNSSYADPSMGLPMGMDDTGMNGGNAGCYYQKDLSAANVYGKNVSAAANRQPTHMNYNQRSVESSHPNVPLSNSQQASVPVPTPAPIETKPKRTRKKKNAAVIEPTPPVQPPVTATDKRQQQQHPQQPYDNRTVPTAYDNIRQQTTEPPIALKTSSSIVPGSAFNFGPSSTAGLGLGTGIYGENTSYLDDYRNAANPYAYLPQTHRNPSDPNNDPNVNAAASAAAASAASLPPAPQPTSTYHHQFLPHHPTSRGTYPFMNAPLEPNTQFYQQYLRNEEYRQARMMLNQGILGHSTPSAYPQPGYHPALGMHKPYDAMNRPPWFP